MSSSFLPQSPVAIFIVGYLLSFVITAVVMMVSLRNKKPLFKPGDPVDAWAMQSMLMRASNQAMPSLPQVNKTTLLYWALMLEEMSETGEGLFDVLSRHWQRHDSRAYSPESLICIQMHTDVQVLKHASIRLRRILETFKDFELEMTRKEMKALLDGTTDNAVVNAGFAIGSGMPGAEAYLEVVTSNLSKRNPETGLIDKLPDGKWIKGVDYKEPDLDKVLEIQQIKVAGPDEMWNQKVSRREQVKAFAD